MQMATSSFDRTIKLWNAADVSYACQFIYVPGKIYLLKTRVRFLEVQKKMFEFCESNLNVV
jgi:hypothetical protein